MLYFREAKNPEDINWAAEKTWCQRLISKSLWRPLMIILCLMLLSAGMIHYAFFIIQKVVNMHFFMKAPSVDCDVLNYRYGEGLLNMAFTEWLELGGVKYNEDFPNTNFKMDLTENGSSDLSLQANIGYNEYLMQGRHQFPYLNDFDPQKDLSRQGCLSCFC